MFGTSGFQIVGTVDFFAKGKFPLRSSFFKDRFMVSRMKNSITVHMSPFKII